MPADPQHAPETVAFAVQTTVRDGKDWYQPIRLHLAEDGTVRAAHALHEAMPYLALAYEYLQGDLARYYAELQVGLAKTTPPVRDVTVRRHGRPKT